MAPWSATYRLDSDWPGLEQTGWALQVVQATGRGVLPDDATDRLAAERAARIDALLRISRQVDRLAVPYPPGATVGDVLRQNRVDDDVWAAYLETAWVVASECGEGLCSVTVALDLRVLWELVACRVGEAVVKGPGAVG
jgi:hypothetical protein